MPLNGPWNKLPQVNNAKQNLLVLSSYVKLLQGGAVLGKSYRKQIETANGFMIRFARMPSELIDPIRHFTFNHSPKFISS